MSVGIFIAASLLASTFAHLFMGFMVFEWLWLFFIPPWGIGFLGLLFILCVLVEDSNDYMFPVIASYLIGLHYEGYKMTYVFENPGACIGVLLLYLFVGIVWSFFRLYMFARKQTGTNTKPEDFVSRHKYRIYGWIMYWPFSLLHSLFGDLIKEILDFIYTNWLRATYIKIVEKAMRQ